MSKSMIPADYAEFLTGLKERIRSAQITAARAVNRELILLYWDIGHAIVEKQQTARWGDAVVERLAADLRAEFPDMRGFSGRNLRDTKRFYLAYRDEAIWQQAVAKFAGSDDPTPNMRQLVADLGQGTFWPQAVAKLPSGESTGFTGILEQPVPETEFRPQLVAKIPWGHHRFILDKVSDPAARLYYLLCTARFGWSRKVLLNQIKAQAYERATQEKKTHNFALALPEHFAEQADEMMKSRYNLEFLGIGQAMKERDLESRLIERLQQFILELGYGFCFIGRQHRLALGRKEYFVDLLFYHRFLKALVAFDLKLGSFEPEHAGKMDFYLNLLNDRERGPDDQPSIGIILCAEKDDIEVEYALRTKTNPIGVAEYQLQTRLPDEYKGKLPTARQLSDAVRRALPAPKKAR
jgi:predicted nuclease of restriction endonuclease-like (RecB) superfamily